MNNSIKPSFISRTLDRLYPAPDLIGDCDNAYGRAYHLIFDVNGKPRVFTVIDQASFYENLNGIDRWLLESKEIKPKNAAFWTFERLKDAKNFILTSLSADDAIEPVTEAEEIGLAFPTEWVEELLCFVLSEDTEVFKKGVPALSVYDAILRSLRESMEMLTDSGMVTSAQRIRDISQFVESEKTELEISEKERALLV